MDDKTVAPFALPPTEQVFGQPSPSEPVPTAEPQKRRRGRPAKAEGAPKAKRQGRKPAAAPAEGFTVDQIEILRRLTESEFAVVMTIVKQVPQDNWSNIGRALVDLVLP